MHLDVSCIIHTVEFISVQTFGKRVGFKKKKNKKKKDVYRLSQFLQLVVHMYFVPVKLFILEIKGKKKKHLY